MSKSQHRKPAPHDRSHRVIERQSARMNRPVLILAIIGILVTAYLAYVALTGTQAALCTEGSSCDLIQQSRWSHVMGIPVALWGLAVYVLLALHAGWGTQKLRNWRRAWTIALLGLAISVYLTVVGMIELDAVCMWCLLSLAIMTAIFAWLSLRRPESAPGMPLRIWLMNTGMAMIVALGLLHVYYAGLFRPAESPRLAELATHLSANGAKFYGASWCPNCQQQKALFGSSAERLPYVECSPQGRGGMVAFECVSASISAYPTWIIRGQAYPRILQPEELARLTGYKWESTPAAP